MHTACENLRNFENMWVLKQNARAPSIPYVTDPRFSEDLILHIHISTVYHNRSSLNIRSP